MIEIKANPGKHGGVDQRDLTSAALNVQRAFLCSPANPDPAYSWQGTLRSRAKADVQTVLSGFSLSLALICVTDVSSVVFFPSETGGICISPRPSNPGDEILPGMAMRPFFGISPSVLDDKVYL